MTHDDDFAELDRMLAALPLEEPPPGLRARILAATVYRPVPVMRTWEVWVLGFVVALAVWMTWMLASSPHLVERLASASERVIDAGGLTSLSTLLWLAVGVSSAWWISLLTFPSPRRVRAR